MKATIDLCRKYRIRVNEDKKFEYVVLEYYVKKFLDCTYKKMNWVRKNSGIKYFTHRDERNRRFYRVKDVYALHRAIWLWMIEKSRTDARKMPLMFYFKKECDKGGFHLYNNGTCLSKSVTFENSNAKYVQDYRKGLSPAAGD